MEYKLTDQERKVLESYVIQMVELESEYKNKVSCIQASVLGAVEMIMTKQNLPSGEVTLSNDFSTIVIKTEGNQ